MQKLEKQDAEGKLIKKLNVEGPLQKPISERQKKIENNLKARLEKSLERENINPSKKKIDDTRKNLRIIFNSIRYTPLGRK